MGLLLDVNAAPGWHDWLGIGLTVLGFGVAIVQLRKTKKATIAASDELRKARLKLSGDQLSALVPQIQTITSDLDFAILSNDREVAHRALLRFSYLATEAISLLNNLDSDHSELQDRLTETASDALDAKSSILGRPNADVARNAKVVTRKIEKLTVEVSGLVANGRYQIGGDSGVQS